MFAAPASAHQLADRLSALRRVLQHGTNGVDPCGTFLIGMDQRTLRIIGGGLIFLSCLWVAAGVFYWTRMPRIFQATARFTMPENRDLNDPYFVQKELEKVRSKAVLNQAITDLNLKTKWAARYGKDKQLNDDWPYELLKQRVNVIQTRSTTLIEAQVRSEDAIEAAQIANEIALTYRDVCLGDAKNRRLAAGIGLPSLELPSSELKRSAVEIVDVALPPLRPISPNPVVGFLNLVPGFFLGVGGLVMLIKVGGQVSESPS